VLACTELHIGTLWPVLGQYCPLRGGGIGTFVKSEVDVVSNVSKARSFPGVGA
jgi:hypothetical protein